MFADIPVAFIFTLQKQNVNMEKFPVNHRILKISGWQLPFP